MLYIGICDDEKYFLSEEKEIIIKYMKKRDCPCQIDTFDSGTTFIDSGANVPYDILFLDIDLGDVKGFEIVWRKWMGSNWRNESGSMIIMCILYL